MKSPAKRNMIDLYFSDARAKLIDIAAFLDRAEKNKSTNDFRCQSFKTALKCLDGKDRTKNVLLALSDPSTELIPKATTKSASGAWPGNSANNDSLAVCRTLEIVARKSSN